MCDIFFYYYSNRLNRLCTYYKFHTILKSLFTLYLLMQILPCFVILDNINITVGENIIATTKILNNYGTIQSNFQYSDSNIGISSIAPSLLILFASFLVSVFCFFFDGSLSLKQRD